MTLLNNTSSGKLLKDKIEKIQKKKTEYKKLGRFRRSKGLKLFSYNVITQEIKELNVVYSNEAHIFWDGRKLDWYDPLSNKVNIDSRDIHFECLNINNAVKRVSNFKSGKIKSLFNLKPKVNKRINF